MNEPILNRDEIERYARHIVLPEIGGSGQQKLKAAKVAVLGAGGLGSPVIAYLAASGVGTIAIIDDDLVDRSNLQRQIIHDSERIGTDKVSSAAIGATRINPHVNIIGHGVRLNEQNAKRILTPYDLVVDGSDSFATRYAIADAAHLLNIPMIMGAVGRFDGSVTVFKPYDDDNPSIYDLYPEAPPPGLLPSCADSGIVGAVTGVIGTIQAMEAIKLIAGFGEPLVGRLLLYDGLSARFDEITYGRVG